MKKLLYVGSFLLVSICGIVGASFVPLTNTSNQSDINLVLGATETYLAPVISESKGAKGEVVAEVVLEEKTSESETSPSPVPSSNPNATKPAIPVATTNPPVVAKMTRDGKYDMSKPSSCPGMAGSAWCSPDGVQYNLNGAYTYVGDFEKSMLGVCPQDVPAGLWSDPLFPAVSLGYTMIEDSQTNTPEAAVRYVWNFYKRGVIDYGDAYEFANSKDYGISEQSLGFYFNYTKLEVTWAWAFSGSKDFSSLPQTTIDQMDKTAKQMTEHLRYLDHSYNAKCGTAKLTWH